MGEIVDIERLCMGCMMLYNKEEVCPHCGFSMKNYKLAPHQLPPKTILAGKYLAGKVIGEGGFGITYIGLDLNLNLKVAIKEYYPTGFVTRETTTTNTITPYVGEQGEFFDKGRTKFIDEARNLAKFRFMPGIVSVSDFFNENGTAYIVMEYIDGQTFKAYLAKMGGKIPAAQVFDMMKPVIESLGEVHKKGIIHRDISPDNIMITKDGYIKLLDFGAARDFSESGNKSLSVLLKPGYAPEEQYRSKGKQGPWTDIYALCATMYRAITGASPDESIERMSEDLVKPPSQLGIAIDPKQEAALMKGMSVLQKNRFQNIIELKQALYDKGASIAALVRPVEKPIQKVQPSPIAEKSNVANQVEEPSEKTSIPQKMSVPNEVEGSLSERLFPDAKMKKPKKKKLRTVVSIVCVFFLILLGVGNMNKGTKSASSRETASEKKEYKVSESSKPTQSTPSETPQDTQVAEESQQPQDDKLIIERVSYDEVIDSVTTRMESGDVEQFVVGDTLHLCNGVTAEVADIMAILYGEDRAMVYVICDAVGDKPVDLQDYDFLLACESGDYLPISYTVNGSEERDFNGGVGCEIPSQGSAFLDLYYDVPAEDLQYIFCATNMPVNGNDGSVYACNINREDICVNNEDAQGSSQTSEQPTQSAYILPYSEIAYLTAADLAGLTKEQLRLARNEIYARHGRMFNSQDLQDYFNSQSWYTPSIPADSFDENSLNEIEKYNAKFIKQYE